MAKLVVRASGLFSELYEEVCGADSGPFGMLCDAVQSVAEVNWQKNPRITYKFERTWKAAPVA
jgi:hypothetical protein